MVGFEMVEDEVVRCAVLESFACLLGNMLSKVRMLWSLSASLIRIARMS